MEITKGSYTVTIRKNADGAYFALMTYLGDCVPGIRGKHYQTEAAAKRGAATMFRKVA